MNGLNIFIKIAKTDPDIGQWQNCACPACGAPMGIILNRNNSVGFNCRRRCSRGDIFRAAGIKPNDLKKRIRLSAKPGALVPISNEKTVGLANTFLKGGRGFKDRRSPAPSANVLKLFIILAAQCQLKKDAEDDILLPKPLETYTTTAAELSQLLGLQRAAPYSALDGLLHGCLAFVTLAEDRDTGKVRGVRWFDDCCEVDLEAKTITLRLHDAALPYLNGVYPFAYTRFRAASVMALRSTYAILMFMFLSQYTNPKWKTEYKRDKFGIALVDLFRILMIPVGSAARDCWWRFEQDVLRPVKNEIELKTRLRFAYQPMRARDRKIGKVLAVEFYDVKAVEVSEMMEAMRTIKAGKKKKNKKPPDGVTADQYHKWLAALPKPTASPPEQPQQPDHSWKARIARKEEEDAADHVDR